ncbi:MAG: DUF805 domain-containing protein [Alphaproteobacteria bacterium]|nr:DUF805 domain-containing protein [Alphaproteobacteria bacterium]
MKKISNLFFLGRTNRRQFWIMTVICTLTSIMIQVGNLAIITYKDTRYSGPITVSATVTNINTGQVIQNSTLPQNNSPSYDGISSYIIHLIVVIFGVFVFLIPLIKRLHDLGKTGWLSALVVIPVFGPLIWLLLFIYCGLFPGQKSENEFGPPITQTT